MRSDRSQTARFIYAGRRGLRDNLRASLYPDPPHDATDGVLPLLSGLMDSPQKCNAISINVTRLLCGLQLRVFLDEFLCAAAGEAYGDAAVVIVVAFDAYDRAHAEFWMANLASQHWIRVGAAPCC